MLPIPKTRQKQLLATLVVVILVLISTLLFLQNRDQINPDDYVSELSIDNISYGTGISVNLELNDSSFYKDTNIQMNMKVSVNDSNVYISRLYINVSQQERVATQMVWINTTLNPGDHNLLVELSPYFTDTGFIALNYGNYTLTGYSIEYKQRQETQTLSGRLDRLIFITQWPIVDEFVGKSWNASGDASVDIQQNSPVTIIVEPAVNETEVILRTQIQTTAYTQLNFTVSGINNSVISMEMGDELVYSGNSSGYIAVGNFQGLQNFSIILDIVGAETINITISMITQRIPIFVVSANNYWDGLATDGLYFELPQFYIKQVSEVFKSTFNITFREVKMIYFDSNPGSDLFELISSANFAVGRALGLDSNIWKAGPGPQTENAGADIELIFTNKTMDHLGIVIGANGSAYNIAVQARGSNFEGDYRITSNFADNLIQHEISHIFGAPDRWTYLDDPSIMTKSRPEDAFIDIALGNFWLLRNNWLEQDIQTMHHKSRLFL